MKQWLKFFGLSFFSDKIAQNACKRGYGNALLSLALAFVLFMLGFVLSSIVPFASHINNSEEFNALLSNAFDNNGVVLTVENGVLAAGKGAQSPAAIKIANTYLSETDAEKYCAGDYNLIIDARPLDTLIEFSQYAENGSGGKISYAEYRNLSTSAKSEYTVKTEYTDVPLNITEELRSSFVSYLENDQSAATDYAELQNNASQYTSEEYGEQLYYLYVKYYYSDVNSVIYGAKAPVLHDYYYNNYLADYGNDKFCYFFADVCYGSFYTKGGVFVNYGGYYREVNDGEIIGKDAALKLIKDVFYSSTDYVWASFLMNSLFLFAMLLILPLLAALLLFALGKAGNIRQDVGGFGDCYKTVCAFVWFSAFVTALLTFVLGFLLSTSAYYLYMYAVFALLLLARSAVYVFNVKRISQNETVDEDTENTDREDGE